MDGIVDADEFERFFALHDVLFALKGGLGPFGQSQHCLAGVFRAFIEIIDRDIEDIAEFVISTPP